MHQHDRLAFALVEEGDLHVVMDKTRHDTRLQVLTYLAELNCWKPRVYGAAKTFCSALIDGAKK